MLCAFGHRLWARHRLPAPVPWPCTDAALLNSVTVDSTVRPILVLTCVHCPGPGRRDHLPCALPEPLLVSTRNTKCALTPACKLCFVGTGIWGVGLVRNRTSHQYGAKSVRRGDGPSNYHDANDRPARSARHRQLCGCCDVAYDRGDAHKYRQWCSLPRYDAACEHPGLPVLLLPKGDSIC